MALKKPRTIDRTGKPAGADPKARWWAETDERLFDSVFSIARAIRADQALRRSQLVEHARLYGNDMPGLGETQIRKRTRRSRRVTYNVIKSCISTACAKISKNKPRPLVLTSEGDWPLQQKAKKLTRYLDGRFVELKAHAEGQKVFRDASIFGTGLGRVYREDWSIRFERTMVDEILVDANEAMYGAPRSLHQRRVISREVLIGLFPEQESKIDLAEKVDTDGAYAGNRSTRSDMIEVLESWHLASVRDGDDGRHSITVSNATLLSEGYTKDHFPFVVMHWDEPVHGWWGTGIAEELLGIQLEINELLRRIQTAQRLMCAPAYMVEDGSKVLEEQLGTNEIGRIITYTGTPPSISPGLAMPVEVYQQLEQLYKRAFELCGISQMAASAIKPAGLDSGAALREKEDIDSERFILVGQRYEAFYLELARIVIDLQRDMQADFDALKKKAKGGSDADKKELERAQSLLRVRAPSGKFVDSIDWSEVDMADDEYSMSIFPTSMLPNTPAGRIQTVTEMMQYGLVTPQQGLTLLDFPDLEDSVTLQTAALQDIRMVLDSMLAGGAYMSPEPFMDLQLARTTAQSTYLRAKTRKVPEGDLAKLRQFMADCSTMLQSAAPAPNAAPLPGGGPPAPTPGAPAMPPAAPPPMPGVPGLPPNTTH